MNVLLDESWSPFSDQEERGLIREAQQGCQRSLNRLMAGYEQRLEALVGCHAKSCLSHQEALQAARLGLWQAIVAYEPGGGGRLWGQAWGVVSTAIWQEAKRVEWRRRLRRFGQLSLTEVDANMPMSLGDSLEIQAVLGEMVAQLPERLQYVLAAYYGLDGQPSLSVLQIGQALGLSRQRVWQLRQEALALLSHPGHSARLRTLLGRHTLADYLAARRRVQRWLRRRGGRSPEESDAYGS